MPFWHALPPEVNALRLITGAGPAPMMARAEAYSAIAAAAAAQEAEVVSAMGVLSATSDGLTADAIQTSHVPYIGWLQYLTTTMSESAARAARQGAAHGEAVAMTPPLPVIAANRAAAVSLQSANIATGGALTGAVLANETAYMEMWTQAAVAMDVYSGQTAANLPVDPTQNAQSITAGGSAGTSAAGGAANSSSAVSSILQAAQAALQPAVQMLSNLMNLAGSSSSRSALAPGSRFQALMSFLSGRIGADTDMPNVGFAGAGIASPLLASFSGAPSGTSTAGGGGSYGAGVTAARGVMPTAPSFTMPSSWSGPASVTPAAALAGTASTAESAVPLTAQTAAGAPPVLPRAATNGETAIAMRSTRLSPTVSFVDDDQATVGTPEIPTDPAPELEPETA